MIRHLICLIFLMVANSVMAQNQTVIQVKAFDSNLQAVRDVELTLNKKIKLNTGARGVVVITISDSELPVQSIDVTDQALEAASWNFSKGVLEVMIRKKNYRIQSVLIVDSKKQPVTGVEVTFNGARKVIVKTDAKGRIELPVGLDEKTPMASQFTITDYRVSTAELRDGLWNLTADKVVKSEPIIVREQTSEPVSRSYIAEIATLDTTRNLSQFYQVIRNIDMDNIDEAEKARIDNRFNQLLNELVQTSGREAELPDVSVDSTTTEELKALIMRATQEGRELERQRSEFDKRIADLGTRLSSGIANMDADARDRLLNDIVLLENLLEENETRFKRNQEEYKQVINSLKENYFDIQVLEDKLSESEKLRLEDQRRFRQRLLLALILGIIFAILILMLARFSARLGKQKKQLQAANEEVRQINENLESIVERRTRLLQAANNELDTFLYRAAHDLRTPVASIFGLINLSAYLSQSEFLEKVKSSNEKMDRLLGRLNIISQINHPTGLAEINVSELFKELNEKFKAKAVGLTVELIFSVDHDLKLTTYDTLLNQVLNNLIENAIYFSSLGKNVPKVNVTARAGRGIIQFTVQDNGMGIDAETLPHIFKMFYKGYERSEGHGLGLYIVHRCISPMKGSVEVDSKPNVQTTFTVKFPLSLK